MKTNKTIEASKRKAADWGFFLLDTFQELGIKDNEVIRNCHIGRSTFYHLKQGKLINVDAYIRLLEYTVSKIQEQTARHLLPNDFAGKWREKINCFVWRGFFIPN